jgi:hypothetical protein
MVGHTAIILIALVIAASVIAAGVTITHYPTNNPKQNNGADSNPPVDVNVRGTTFTDIGGNTKITVQINLDNGMNHAEAVVVGDKVFGYDDLSFGSYHTDGNATVNELGVWPVYYNWGAGDESLGHFRFVDIYPSNQTFYFESCD